MSRRSKATPRLWIEPPYLCFHCTSDSENIECKTHAEVINGEAKIYFDFSCKICHARTSVEFAKIETELLPPRIKDSHIPKKPLVKAITSIPSDVANSLTHREHPITRRREQRSNDSDIKFLRDLGIKAD